MNTQAFKAIGEVTADGRARIPFGKAGVRQDDRYAVAMNDDGEILLTPLVSIPKRELLVWENEAIRSSLARGLEQSAAGDVVSRGSFAQYLDEDGDEDAEPGTEANPVA
ncbi:hypothetical protein SAMN06295974_1929 [Plantibacter flavus]|uniref:SpoVT-AbrB domain-containing protein n=1 Tax=Plantibacter flavus TaxID=150123 RepID=A0A3N2BY68_9MICO|nr:hypothetical protein [Plantibacter flavus]ROR80034.1 hypothetical protein EDD42_0066 [Plantibacter flavus]SMG28838.1 hypothetical protein SAMN06295974_1929 [Plantibacter flavus]